MGFVLSVVEMQGHVFLLLTTQRLLWFPRFVGRLLFGSLRSKISSLDVVIFPKKIKKYSKTNGLGKGRLDQWKPHGRCLRLIVAERRVFPGHGRLGDVHWGATIQ